MGEPATIILNCRELYTYAKSMVDWLLKLPDVRIILVDNASAYRPLLHYYDSLAGSPVKVIRLPENIGKFAPWQSGVVARECGQFYVVSDPDLDMEGVPLDVLDRLKAGLLRHHACKAGLSLRLDDIPDNSLVGSEAKHWESQFWQTKLDDQFFDAPTDTTFAMYNKAVTDGRQVRAAPPYMARHLPWYLGADNMTNEYRYYLSTASRVSDWGNKMTRAQRTRDEQPKGRFVTFTFDDGDVQTAMQVNQILEPDHATFYIVTGWTDDTVKITDQYNIGVNHGTDLDWRALAYWGHDIGSHTVSHVTPPEALRNDEYKRSLEYLKRFGVGPYSLSMPFHVAGAVDAPYDSIRCGNSVRYNPLDVPLREVGSWTIYPDKFAEIVEQLRDKNPADCWTVFCMHGLDGRLAVPWGRGDFERLMNMCRVLGYRVRTMAEMEKLRKGK